MKATVYLRKDCPNCQDVDFYDDINIEKVYVDEDNYEGYQPDQVPVMQFKGVNGFNVTGVWHINHFTSIMRDCQYGLFRK